MDHAARIRAQSQVAEEQGPARWKVLLVLPFLGAMMYFTLVCLLSYQG